MSEGHQIQQQTSYKYRDRDDTGVQSCDPSDPVAALRRRGVIAILQTRKLRLRLNRSLVVPWPVNTKKIRTQACPLGLTGRFQGSLKGQNKVSICQPHAPPPHGQASIHCAQPQKRAWRGRLVLSQEAEEGRGEGQRCTSP